MTDPIATPTPEPAPTRRDGWENLPDADDPERGDVPGWVLITLMTAGLVMAIWVVAGDALRDVFELAITRITGYTG